MKVQKPSRAGRIKILAAGVILMVLAPLLVIACQAGVAAPEGTGADGENCELPPQEVAMSSGKVEAGALTVPTIDLVRPERVETATFALG